MLHVFMVRLMGNKKKRNEGRSERFRRIAENRTNQILRVIKLLGNCSNKSSYSFTEQEVDNIFSAIGKELKQAKARFTFNRKKTFKL